MWQLGQRDLVGLGWRTELGPFILTHLDQIDVVEVIIDDYFDYSQAKLRPLRTLAQQVPVLYHGVGLGLATSFPVNQQHLDKLARALNYLAPEIWSEHLAFVRAGNIEIGHLAAPPRSLATIEGTLKNLAYIKKTIGSLPLLENIATLINPPGSTLHEAQWTKEIVMHANGELLLDLNNLYSNAINFGFDPVAYLLAFPLSKVKVVHLSGGKWIDEPKDFASSAHSKRLLDDHLHDIPAPVFDLLALLATKISHPITVIIERDGEYPSFQELLNQIQRTKNILQHARNSICIGERLERSNL